MRKEYVKLFSLLTWAGTHVPYPSLIAARLLHRALMTPRASNSPSSRSNSFSILKFVPEMLQSQMLYTPTEPLPHDFRSADRSVSTHLGDVTAFTDTATIQASDFFVPHQQPIIPTNFWSSTDFSKLHSDFVDGYVDGEGIDYLPFTLDDQVPDDC